MKIVSPYNVDEFDILRHQCNLILQYPTLSSDLCNSFPLREFDRLLLNSYDHPNHKNALLHIDEIFSYIQDEVALGQMSGPFTWDDLKKEARGNVIVSPLGVVDKVGEPGKLCITCDLSFKGKAPFSVNDKINKNALLTKWGTAAMIIDLICASYCFPPIYSSAAMAPFIVITPCISRESDILLLVPLHCLRVQMGDAPESLYQ
jgi:hypothetical protein